MIFDFLISGKRRLSELLRANEFTAAANAAATFTIAANADRRNRVVKVYWSYSGTPTGGRLTVAIGGTTEYDLDITSGGPGSLNLAHCVGEVNEAIVVTLAAGGASVTGKVSADYVIEPTNV